MEIVFVLVEPAVPENIGAAARALNTMGFAELRMVNPKTDLSGKAAIVAHGSKEILHNALIFDEYSKAINDLDFVVATSAKRRRTNENYIEANKLHAFLESKNKYIGKAGIIFGREESGLSNEEISSADIITSIPLKRPYPSLNLSQAVMLYAYELSELHFREITKTDRNEPSIRNLKEKATRVLSDIEIKQAHIIRPRIMERLSFLDNEDLNLLHSVLSAIIEKERN